MQVAGIVKCARIFEGPAASFAEILISCVGLCHYVDASYQECVPRGHRWKVKYIEALDVNMEVGPFFAICNFCFSPCPF